MPSDPLPLPDILAAQPSDADYEAVYTEVMATDRGRRFLAEYANRTRHPETHRLVSTIARLEAAMHDDPRPQMPVAFARGLADLAITIGQIEAVLLTSGTSGRDVHFAVERIEDIAMALRQHEVEAALCDTLEAAIREVGEAIVRNDAGAGRAVSAAALLRDVARRVNDMIALAASVAVPEVSPIGRRLDVESPWDATTERSGDTAETSTPDFVEAHTSDEGDARSLLQSVAVHPPVRDSQAPVGAKDDVAGLFEPVLLPVPSPLDGRDEAAGTADHEGEVASEPVSAESAMSVEAAAFDAMGNNAPPALAPLPRPPVDETAAAPVVPPAASYDPLATLRALSEEELIALFS
jgi:hypothetical protein